MYDKQDVVFDRNVIDKMKAKEVREARENSLATSINLIDPILNHIEMLILYYLIFRFLPFWLALAVAIARSYTILASIYVATSIFFGADVCEDPLEDELEKN